MDDLILASANVVNPATAYLASLQSKGSRRVQRAAIANVAAVVAGKRVDPEAFPWHLLRRHHVAAIKVELVKRLSPATVNRTLAALRMTLGEAKRIRGPDGVRILSLEDYTDAVDVANVSRKALPAGREVTRVELSAMFGVCEARDAAILATIYGGGLRRSEAVRLLITDWNADVGSIAVRHGKGDKDRIVFLPDQSRAAIVAWIQVRGDGDGALFNIKSPEGIREILKNVAAKAAVAPFSPHDLRRSYISHMIEAGADLSVIRDQVGHANVQTTVSYDRRGDRAKAAAAKLLSVPYLGR